MNLEAEHKFTITRDMLKNILDQIEFEKKEIKQVYVECSLSLSDTPVWVIQCDKNPTPYSIPIPISEQDTLIPLVNKNESGQLKLPEKSTTRLRFVNDHAAIITVKIPTGEAGVNYEFEYTLPIDDWGTLSAISDSADKTKKIEKTRYSATTDGLQIDIDVFKNITPEIILMEIEFTDLEEYRSFNKSRFPYKMDVTGDPYYSNINLAKL